MHSAIEFYATMAGIFFVLYLLVALHAAATRHPDSAKMFRGAVFAALVWPFYGYVSLRILVRSMS